jgi:hypothetical protein
MHGQATGNQGLTRLTTVRTWGKPPPSPLYYTMCLATGSTPKCHFVSRLPSAIPKFSKLGNPQLWGPITLCVDLQLRWGLKQSCSPHRDLSNGMWHVTYMLPAHHLHASKWRRFPTFSGWELNYQFDSQPFFWL